MNFFFKVRYKGTSTFFSIQTLFKKYSIVPEGFKQLSFIVYIKVTIVTTWLNPETFFFQSALIFTIPTQFEKKIIDDSNALWKTYLFLNRRYQRMDRTLKTIF